MILIYVYSLNISIRYKICIHFFIGITTIRKYIFFIFRKGFLPTTQNCYYFVWVSSVLSSRLFGLVRCLPGAVCLVHREAVDGNLSRFFLYIHSLQWIMGRPLRSGQTTMRGWLTPSAKKKTFNQKRKQAWNPGKKTSNEDTDTEFLFA